MNCLTNICCLVKVIPRKTKVLIIVIATREKCLTGYHQKKNHAKTILGAIALSTLLLNPLKSFSQDNIVENNSLETKINSQMIVENIDSSFTNIETKTNTSSKPISQSKNNSSPKQSFSSKQNSTSGSSYSSMKTSSAKLEVYSPVDEAKISSMYGWRRYYNKEHKLIKEFHSGIDIGAKWNSRVYAAEGGVVEFAGWVRGYGYRIVINHGKDAQGDVIKTSYSHLRRKLMVHKGDTVFAGERIAFVGNTGNSTGPHLHFEYIENGRKRNPKYYFKNNKHLRKYSLLKRKNPLFDVKKIPTKKFEQFVVDDIDYLPSINRVVPEPLLVDKKLSKREAKKLIADISSRIITKFELNNYEDLEFNIEDPLTAELIDNSPNDLTNHKSDKTAYAKTSSSETNLYKDSSVKSNSNDGSFSDDDLITESTIEVVVGKTNLITNNSLTNVKNNDPNIEQSSHKGRVQYGTERIISKEKSDLDYFVLTKENLTSMNYDLFRKLDSDKKEEVLAFIDAYFDDPDGFGDRSLTIPIGKKSSYKDSLTNKTKIILSPDNKFLRYMN